MATIEGSGGRSPASESLSRALSSCRRFLGTAMAVSMVINMLMLTGPMFMLQIYDRVLTSYSVPTLIGLSAIAVGLYLFYGALEALRSRILARVGENLDNHLTSSAFDLHVTLPYAAGIKGGQVEPMRDLDRIRQFVSGAGVNAIFDSPWMPLYLFVVYLFHPLLCLVGVIGVGIIASLILINEFTTRASVERLSEHEPRRNEMLRTRRDNAEVILAMGMIDDIAKRWREANGTYLESARRAADRSSFFTSMIRMFRFGLQSAVLGFGAYMVIQDEMSPGAMIAASIITSRAVAPIEIAAAHWRGFIQMRQSLKRLKGYMRREHRVLPETELPLPSRGLRVSDLSSAAPGGRELIVRSVNFALESGAVWGLSVRRVAARARWLGRW